MQHFCHSAHILEMQISASSSSPGYMCDSKKEFRAFSPSLLAGGGSSALLTTTAGGGGDGEC
jgi:hypothetical protein